MRTMDELGDVAGFYAHFAEHEAKGESATFARWAAGVAQDPEVLALLEELPTAKRQPNLVFAAARWHGAATPSCYDADGGLRDVLLTRWSRVRETILTRATQTNEVGRSASLLPLLSGLPGPLALVEVGASAGLCLHPDRWSYRYLDDGGAEVARIDPVGGPSPVVLECTVTGPAPIPPSPPVVVHRGGVDLNPLDLSADDNAAWLETLVWPEHEDRRQRLAAACEQVADVAVDVITGDLRTSLDEAVERARAAAPGATLVVFHTAVIAYLDEGGRRAWPQVVTEALERVRADGGAAHWISNEGVDVLPGVSATAPCEPVDAGFCLALDGQAVAWTHGHGRRLEWC
ncbi:DUF2332 domain-containing protein [Janibacter cremeus]|uniref:DUF2332 domain-containing protein n=1 Tax=Janibacter cremeus TaxID=1285192 RepID=UPI0023FA1A78|nr:DUF2332 domain-containing protein [Janibacter cremeus]WEV78933.1 DUF2332 domain-containing protein [Janibacter cremeus]